MFTNTLGRSLLCCAVILAFAGANPSAAARDAKKQEEPAKSTDGAEFSQPVDSVIASVNMQAFGAAMMSPLDEVVKREKVWSLGGETTHADRSRSFMADTNVDATRWQWVCVGRQGALYMLLGEEEGRVRRVGLLGTISADEAQAVARRVLRGGIFDPKNSSVAYQNLTMRVRTSGEWKRIIKGVRDINGNLTPDRTQRGPALLEIELDDWDFYGATRAQTKEFFDAAKKGQLKVGMNYVEAYIAMKRFASLKRVKGDADGSETWTWYRSVEKVQGRTVYVSNLETFYTTQIKVEDVPQVRAVFVGGRLESWEDLSHR